MKAKKPITVSTILDLGQNDMTLGLYCAACDRWAESVPEEWLPARANVSFLHRTFRGRDCGASADKQVRPRT